MIKLIIYNYPIREISFNQRNFDEVLQEKDVPLDDSEINI